jgi:hypothetical protein
MANLPAADVLTGHFARVTIVERDRFPTSYGTRCPTGRHERPEQPRRATVRP